MVLFTLKNAKRYNVSTIDSLCKGNKFPVIVKEIKRFDETDLRNLCIEQGWFTKGDNKMYCKLLSKVHTAYMDVQDDIKSEKYNETFTDIFLSEIAEFILYNSDLDDSDCQAEYFTNILYYLNKISITTYHILQN
jgi:hypothetical protein